MGTREKMVGVDRTIEASLGSWVLLRSLRIVDRLKMKTTTTKEMGRGGRGNRVREIVPMRR